VTHQPVDRDRRHHRVLEDLVPLAEPQLLLLELRGVASPQLPEHRLRLQRRSIALFLRLPIPLEQRHHIAIPHLDERVGSRSSASRLLRLGRQRAALPPAGRPDRQTGRCGSLLLILTFHPLLPEQIHLLAGEPTVPTRHIGPHVRAAPTSTEPS